MSMPAQPALQTLDLYGGGRMRGTGIAAVGFWILAVGFFVLAAQALWLAALSMGAGRTGYLISSWIGTGGRLLVCAGVGLVALAGIGRGAISSWPRWLAAAGILANYVLGFAAMIAMNLVFRSAWSSGSGSSTFTHYLEVSYGLSAFFILVQGFGQLCAMIYALQVARWRHSTSLAVSSAVVFAIGILVTAIDIARHAVMVFLLLTESPSGLFGPTLFAPAAFHIIFGLVLAMFAVYYAVLALRVVRMRADR